MRRSYRAIVFIVGVKIARRNFGAKNIASPFSPHGNLGAKNIAAPLASPGISVLTISPGGLLIAGSGYIYGHRDVCIVKSGR